MKNFFDFYIFSDIHVALATSFLTYISLVLFDINVSWSLLFFTFFSTLSAYQFIRIFTDFFHQKVNFFQFVKTIEIWRWFFLSIASFCSLYLIGFLSYLQILILLPIVFLSIWYAVPVFYFLKMGHSLRQYPELKIFIIASVWVLLTVVLPLIAYWHTWNFWVILFQRLVFVLAITIPFDIRDAMSDNLELQTLPQKLGVFQAKKIGVLMMMVFFILIFIKNPLSSFMILSEMGILLVTLFFLMISKPKRNVYFTSFWVEALPVFWGIFVIIWKIVLH